MHRGTGAGALSRQPSSPAPGPIPVQSLLRSSSVKPREGSFHAWLGESTTVSLIIFLRPRRDLHTPYPYVGEPCAPQLVPADVTFRGPHAQRWAPAGLASLRVLSLDRCEALTSVAPLAELTRLEALSLALCGRLTGLTRLSCAPCTEIKPPSTTSFCRSAASLLQCWPHRPHPAQLCTLY